MNKSGRDGCNGCNGLPKCLCTSTRFWPKSRSYRKQMSKPFPPGPHPATCDFCTILLQLRKATIQRSAVFASANL